MKQKTIKRAVKVINRNIEVYQRKLTYQLELMNEALLENGNLKDDSFDSDANLIEKYESILADLATIRRAVANNKTTVKLNGPLKTGNCIIYPEIVKTLEKAGLDFQCYGLGELIVLNPIDELEEE